MAGENAPAASAAPVAAPVAAPAAPAAAATPAAAPAVAAPAAAAPAAPAAGTPPAAAAPAAAKPEVVTNLFDEPAEEGKPAEGAEDKESKESKEGEKATAPADYTLTLPEGMTLDDQALDSVRGAFADAAVPADKAQSLFDRFVQGVGAARQAALADATQHWNDMQKDLKAEVAADPKLGGAKLQATLQEINSGALALTDAATAKAFKQALSTTGAGNYLAVVRMLHAALSPHAAAKPVNGGRPGTSKGAVQSMYPSATGGSGSTLSPLS